MKLFLILLLIFLSACKVDTDDLFGNNDPYYNSSDPYFDPYKREFEESYYLYTGKTIDTTKYKINITNNKYFRTNSYADGVCFRDNDEILIRKDSWSRMDEVQRKVLFYHELGHCALKRNHIEGYNGIMASSWVGPVHVWEQGYDEELLVEFFTSNQESKEFLTSLMRTTL